MSWAKHRDPSKAERRLRWLALLDEVRAAALSATRAAQGDGAGPDRIALASIAGQLRSRRADEPTPGINGAVFRRFILTGRDFAEPSTDPVARAALASRLAEDVLELVAATPAAPGEEEAAADAEAIARKRGYLE